VHAQATADIDFSQAEQTAETFGPNQPPNQAALRSQQTLESQSGGGQNPAGVPGALSNQPPVPATAPIVAPTSALTEAANGTGANLRKEATTNYEVDRTIRYTKLPVGSIKRLSVAVIVNDRTVTDKSGKTTSRPLTASEKEQIYALVKEAMGFSESRGDTLKVENSAFNVEKEAPAAEVPLWKQPEMIALAKDALRYLIIAGIGLYLVFGVIRPAFRNIENARKQAEEEKVRQTEEEKKAAMEHHVAPEGQAAYDNTLQSVQQMAQTDPKVVAAVVKEWVNKE